MVSSSLANWRRVLNLSAVHKQVRHVFFAPAPGVSTIMHFPHHSKNRPMLNGSNGNKFRIKLQMGSTSTQDNQTREYRSIEKCNDSTVIVHVDFLRRGNAMSEVQSCHFGPNLPQLNLHTGMYYTEEQKTGFCTVSESKRQDASAICTHMEPVLKDIRLKFPKCPSNSRFQENKVLSRLFTGVESSLYWR
ncbi:hypothetical protein F2P79_023366 [Pimephales promelas]|nr:hypothetical protein F2P79_023366 [Pimephales promelas]